MLPIRTFLTAPSAASFWSMLTADSGVALEMDVAYGPLARQRADIYRPRNAQKPRAIVLFIYGGGWDSGERTYYGFVGAALAARGLTAVVADYRLFPEVRYPAFQNDMAAAYGWTCRTLATECGEDCPIFIAGHSAGAHIGALLCFDRSFLEAEGLSLPPPRGFIGLSGPYAYDPTTHERSRHIFEDAHSADQVRPIAHVSAGAPPSLLMHGARDNVVQFANAEALAAKLVEAGSEAEAIEFSNLGHINLVLALSRPLRWRAPVLANMLAFINRHAPSDAVKS